MSYGNKYNYTCPNMTSKCNKWLSSQLIINHEGYATLEQAFYIWEKVDLGFCVVDVGKLVVTMTTQKDSNTTRKCGFSI